MKSEVLNDKTLTSTFVWSTKAWSKNTMTNELSVPTSSTRDDIICLCYVLDCKVPGPFLVTFVFDCFASLL